MSSAATWTCPICQADCAGPCARCGAAVRPLENGIFESVDAASQSYPDEGNDEMAAVEESSYWFQHRNRVIQSAVKRRPWTGTLLDVGGGNGFQARALSSAGRVVLVEPGLHGCLNAARRGSSPVVRATLDSLRLKEETIGAVSLFDVLEHLDERDATLASAFRALRRGGRLYLTVPAYDWLWSHEDEYAQHKLRYTQATLERDLRRAGFDAEHSTYFFAPLVLPVLLLRSLPYRLGSGVSRGGGAEDHSSAGLAGRALVALLQAEHGRLAKDRTLPLGSSLLCVARKP